MASPSSRGSSFRRLWLVGLLVRIADGVRGVALPWLVLVQTGSPFQLGVTLALGAVDTLLGPVVGPLIDRLPRRTVVGAGVVGYGVTLLALAATIRLGNPGIAAVYVAAVGVSVSQFIYHNARHAWLPELVSDLDAANAAVHGTGTAARAAFLLFGGAVTTLATPATALGLAGVGALLAVGPLATLPPGRVSSGEGRTSASDGYDSTAGGRAERLRRAMATWTTRLRIALSDVRGGTLGTVVALSVGINLVMPAYGVLFATLTDRLAATASAFALLRGGFTVGKLPGNALAARLDWDRSTAVWRGVVLSGVATLGLAGVGGTVLARPVVTGSAVIRSLAPITGMVSMPVSAGVALVGLAALAVGATQPLFNVPTDGIVQASVPADRRGTVVTLTNTLYQLPFPVAYLGGGWLADRLSAPVGFVVAGATLLVVGLWARRLGAATDAVSLDKVADG